MTTFITALILIGCGAFLIIETIGLINDIRKRKKLKDELYKDNQDTTNETK